MFTETVNVREVPANLDSIMVYFTDFQIGSGMVTLVCFGNAWSAYFGAMGGNTIREFFEKAGTEYLVNKLGYSQVLKRRKQDLNYLGRVIDATKSALREAAEPTMSNGQILGRDPVETRSGDGL